MQDYLKTKSLFSFEHTLAAKLLSECEYPWQAIPKIKEFILKLGKTLNPDIYTEVKEGVWIAKSAKIAPTSYIGAPTVIGEESEIRHSAFIRGSVIIGKRCVVGNSTEMKNSIIFDDVQVPHYNYVGDSVLGWRSHLGAGSVTPNVKSDKTQVSIKIGNEKIETGLKKFGAILADTVEVGCNSVLCPGTVIGKNSTIYPLTRVRGFLPENSIFKGEGQIITKTERQDLI